MSYQVLARKWRPQTFDQIRGQAHIARALSNAIASGRIAHAYLFTGIRGVGKTSAARILAKALNCAEGPTSTPCNQCPSCREITEGKSADVLEIDGASNTGVEDVRRLREAVRYPPVRGPFRIYIIDEVHMLSTAAFNALLKTLEEPPEHVVFVFATTDAHKIPVTILSRCQQFDFKRLAPRELVLLLGDVAGAEGVSIDEKSLAALAREAEGSVRDGQSLLDQVISYAGHEVRYEDVRDVLGVVDRDLLLNVARQVVLRDPRGVLESLAEAEQYGYDVRRFSTDLLDLFRDLAVLNGVGEAADLVDLAAEEVAEAREFSADVPWEELHALFDMLARGLEHLRTASRPAVVLEMTLLKMAKMPPLLSLSEVLGRAGEGGVPLRKPRGLGVEPENRRRGGDLQSKAKSSDPASPAPAPVSPRLPRVDGPAENRAVATEQREIEGRETDAVPGAETSFSAASGAVLRGGESAAAGSEPSGKSVASSGLPDATALWGAVLARAEQTNRPFWSVLQAHAQLDAWDAGQGLAHISYDDPSHDFFLRDKLALLADLISRETGGRKVQVEMSCRGGKSSPRGGSQETDRIRSLKKEAFEHPLVREAVELFDADIEEVRVLKP